MPLELPVREVTVFWYLAVDDNLAMGGQENADDLGADIELVAKTNAYAPAGIGGESIFTNVYLTLFRSNATQLELSLVPIVNGVEQDAIQIIRPAVLVPTREVLEIGLVVFYPSALDPQIATAMRGCWFELELRSVGTIPDGRLIIEGIELEHEQVTEGKQAVNATP
jgi:hypothetical protein